MRQNIRTTRQSGTHRVSDSGGRRRAEWASLPNLAMEMTQEKTVPAPLRRNGDFFLPPISIAEGKRNKFHIFFSDELHDSCLEYFMILSAFLYDQVVFFRERHL